MILITGASGHLGTAVINHLLTKISADKIVALVRNTEKGKALKAKGIEVRIGDYADKTSIEKAVDGISKLLLISGSSEDALTEHKNVIDSAKDAGVSQIYYTSGARNENVSESKLGPLTDAYSTTENYIINSGLPYTIFQNGLYSETLPFFIGYDVVNTGISFPAENGKASFATRDEMGKAIANVLADDGHIYKIYKLTGALSYSFAEIAELLSEFSGEKVAYESPAPKDYEKKLKEYGVGEMDIWYLTLLASIIRNDEYNVVSSDLEELLGHRNTDLEIYLEDTFIN
ncbi:SDR family oxidoreductase [Epilithonimonas xixisoli]|uniref:NAD(P)H dehydrogenase (Quinone) n=1 Tax=Epilithonimonas xixisoli TaxID=1476462 RepID=A0A4V3H2W0_9FLAO|nr:SDR family oxidoreductase [Epilithonimonas xixisoli]TDX86441.1 NAD(P)H dehydrogenase (quinone) [Epilithonimonas xixisoli]